MAYYRSKDGETLDLIVWRYYGRQSDWVVETVLDANPGLADRGPLLPPGLRVFLPDIESEPIQPMVRLWS